METDNICQSITCPCMTPCPMQKAADILGGKWKLAILCSLSTKGATRYNELHRRIGGISNTMLAKSAMNTCRSPYGWSMSSPPQPESFCLSFPSLPDG